MTYVGTCPDCGKLCYLSKGDAKKASRGHKHRSGRLHPYKCGQYWHIGHMPYVVARGVIARENIPAQRRDTL